MDKKSIASGVAAVALATTLAVAPAVTDVDTTEPEAIVEETVVEEVTEEVTEEISETEKEVGESTDELTEEKTEETTEELKLPGEHLEVEPPSYEDYTIEIPYSFKNGSDRTKTLIIDVPDEFSVDIATLYVNDAEVATALLPTDAKFTSIPVVFENLENLEIKLYRMGEEIGSARFINGILLTNAQKPSPGGEGGPLAVDEV